MTNTDKKMFSYFFYRMQCICQSIWCKPEGWLDGLVDGGRGNKINYYYYWGSYQLLQLCFCMPDHLFTIVTRFSCWGSHGKKNCFCLSMLLYGGGWKRGSCINTAAALHLQGGQSILDHHANTTHSHHIFLWLLYDLEKLGHFTCYLSSSYKEYSTRQEMVGSEWTTDASHYHRSDLRLLWEEH